MWNHYIDHVKIFCLINFQASLALQKSLKSLTNKLHCNSLVLEKILTYSEDLKTFK